MIVVWKRINATEYVASWQGYRLTLLWEPSGHNWRVEVDRTRVRDRWTTAVGAMDSIDERISRMITGRGAKADQRPRSPGGWLPQLRMVVAQ